MTDVKSLHELAAETDGKLSDLHETLRVVRRRLTSANDELFRSVGATKDYRSGRWSMTLDEALALGPQVRAVGALAKRKRWTDELVRLTSEIAVLDEIWAANGRWSRFFIVSDGHIHSSMNCSTCNNGAAPTEFGWLPQLSGLTEAEAVAAHGAILCTICYPTAPVEWTGGEAIAKVAEREARAAAKAEREAAKLAKALLPDGSPLTVPHQRLVTLSSAKQWLTDSVSWNRPYPRVNLDRSVQDHHPSYPPDAVAAVAEAIAAKTGETVEATVTAASKRAAKRDGVTWTPPTKGTP